MIAQDIFFAQGAVIQLDIADRTGQRIRIAAVGSFAIAESHVVRAVEQAGTEVDAHAAFLDHFAIQIDAVKIAAVHGKGQLMLLGKIHIIERYGRSADLMRARSVAGFHADGMSVHINGDVVVLPGAVSQEKQGIDAAARHGKGRVEGKVLQPDEGGYIAAGIDGAFSAIHAHHLAFGIRPGGRCPDGLRHHRHHRSRHHGTDAQHGRQQDRIRLCRSLLHLSFSFFSCMKAAQAVQPLAYISIIA